ncbi:MAG: hypothetical protein US69_C0029G0003 [candidate division TM6 bacterium GW2011_GWF2_38_10]|nr:MAG: hypothetical protein US69_C0029G0003 [candidate division TM6 bacterium GW2011_GWF2_38_10]
MMKKKMSIGIHDFKELIERNYYYVDKSMFIYELVAQESAKVTIIPRPRRFGKTLNMTMLKYFFEKPLDCSSNAHLFKGLAISQYPEIMARQGTHPIIFITFKGIKSSTWDECYKELKTAVSVEFKRHAYILQHEIVSDSDKKIIVDIIEKKADIHDYKYALAFLSTLLCKIHGTKPIILIDEYDAPMHAGFEFTYYEEIKNFMYSFFCAGLKDNNNLEFSVITGILRISKESLFSGINNTATFSLMNDIYADKFGFTHDEVATIHDYYTLPFDIAEIKRWYNGYRVGSEKVDGTFTTIYNPWSIIECVSNKKIGPFWINTGGHFLIQETMKYASAEDKDALQSILDGKAVTQTINDAIVFDTIYTDSTSMWSFLVFTGYLTWEARTDMIGKTTAALIAPNFEVQDALKTMVMSWFSSAGIEDTFKEMVSALINLNLPYFGELFSESVMASVSFFDVPKVRPENMYHAFVLGMFVTLADTYVITSNLEAGKGRYDVAIVPKDRTKPGAVFEFKRKLKKDPRTLEQVAQEALEQIDERQYTLPLKKQGITRIAKVGIAFEGKEVEVAFSVEE